MTAAAPNLQGTLDLLVACVKHLGTAVLAIWGVKDDGTCLCPLGPKCKSPGKHPNGKLCPNGVKNATRDTSILRQWVRQAPRGNWAIRCGEPLPDGGFLGVFDWDPRNGALETLEIIHARGNELPDTVQQASGGGGGHRLYRFPHSPASRSVGPGLDLQGRGKYIVVAPSRHASGGVYTWELGAGPGDVAVADAPAWLLEGTDEARPRPKPDGGTARETVLGEIFALAGRAGPILPDGSMCVDCIQSHLHSDARGRGQDASTVILPPAGGSRFGGYRCLHGHCTNLKWQDVVKFFPKEIVDAAHAKYPRLGIVREVPAETPLAAETETEPADDKERERREINKMQRMLAYKETKGGKSVPIPDIVNLNIILTHDPRWKGVLRYDEFANVLRITREPPWHPEDKGRGSSDTWADEDVTRLDMWLRRTFGFEIAPEKIHSVVYVVGRRDGFNPLQDYLNSLRWDGTPRVDTWLVKYAGAGDTPYVRTVGRKWLLSAVARAYKPGCKVDTCLILEGEQGKKKSTLFRVLATGSPEEGGVSSWFSDTPLDLGNKDAYMSIRGKWIIELAELASLKRADLERVKTFFSSPVDSYRPPYGREQVTIPRTAVFCGTTNDREYLQDPTGARRFWPVKTGVLDIEALVADRDQLWAEAVAIYKDWVARGSPASECLWWPAPEEIQMFEVEQSLRQVAGARHQWTEAIALWLTSQQAKEILATRGYLLIRDIARYALHLDDKDLDSGKMTGIGIVMSRELEWEKSRVTIAGVRTWCYRPPSAQSSGA